MHDIELTGLDGANLLGYLAALGTLRVLTLAEPLAQVRMRWEDRGWWRPVVRHSRVKTGADLIQALEARVCGEPSINSAWKIGDDLTLAQVDFRTHLEREASSAGNTRRDVADFLTAFGSDLAFRNKNGQMSDTEFRTMSGSGNQHFLKFLRELATGTESGHLRRALLERWDYTDEGAYMRWDPADYRPHALRAKDPSDDPPRTVRGANRLAVEALPLFPTVPEKAQLRTVAFEDIDKQTEITWPIWIEDLGLDVVKSLLAAEEVQKSDCHRLARRGIAQVFRARRFTDGKFRNFSPARAMI